MTRAKRARTESRIAADIDNAEEEEIRRLERAPPPPGPHQGAALCAMRVLLSRRSLLLVVVLALMAVVLHVASSAAADRAPDRMRRRLDMRAHFAGMTDLEFARYYRVPSKDAFHNLVKHITPPPKILSRERRSARKTTGGYVERDLCISMALRFLAGGAYLDIMYLHGVSRTTVYRHVFSTLNALDAALPAFTLDEDIHDLERCRRLSSVFAAKTDGHIQGAIAAWDGILFKVQKPTQLNKNKVANPNKFHCRKGFPGVSVQAACDGDRRFTYMSMDFAASVHDARAYRHARTRRGPLMAMELECSETMAMANDEHGHPFGFFILGDDAYPCRESNRMVTPWSCVQLSAHSECSSRNSSSWPAP